MVDLDLSENSLTGTIPSSLTSYLNSSSLVEYCYIYLNDNKLSGTVPSDLLSRTAPKLNTLSILLSNNQLTGALLSDTFPSTLPKLQTVYYDVSGNKLTGTVPADLFLPLADLAEYGTISFSAASNGLTGPIPEFVGDSDMYVPTFVVDLSNNKLEGTLPSHIASTIRTGYCWLNLASNKLTGTVPHTLLDTQYVNYDYSLYLGNNQLSGDLPSNLSMGGHSGVTVSLASNKITGTLPSSFLSKTESLDALSLDLSNNDFTGSIPSDFISAFTGKTNPYTTDLNLYLSNCGLSGSIPDSIRGNIRFANFDFSNNNLSGPIPSIMNISVSSNALTFKAAHNKLTGRLSFPSLPGGYSFSVNVSHNELTELVIENDDVKYISSLDVSSNTNLTGNFSVGSLFDGASNLRVLNASHTSMSGEFPDLSGQILDMDLRVLDLSNTNIDFCSGNRTLWLVPTLVSCDLRNTNASTSCSSAYPAICTSNEGRTTKPPVASAPSQLYGLVGSLVAICVIALFSV